jgi:hypothetical protein
MTCGWSHRTVLTAATLLYAAVSSAQDVGRATEAPSPRGVPRPGAAAPAPMPTRAALRAISLTLVAADMQSDTISDDVPPPARRALEELKAFLPFKGYQLWDAGVIGAPSETTPATLRLRGQDTQLFEITLTRPKWATDGALDVVMRDATIASGGTRSGAGGRLPAIVVVPMPRGESLMSANVRLDAGETVIVGTSRVRGDRALVLLITGLPSSAGATRAGASPGPANPAPAPAPAAPKRAF